ncbi:MAG: hypothetical protein ACR2OE_00330 [Thermomicrobiales bacterium]
MSKKDIDAGARGLDEIASQLKEIQVGILCVTAENQQSSWLNFEAGALSKLMENRTFVIPLAFDLDKAQVLLPLGQFQAMQFNRDDMLHVVRTVSKALDSTLSGIRLERVFDKQWPELEETIQQLRAEHTHQEPESDSEKRTTDDMLEELIVSSRNQYQLLRQSGVGAQVASVPTAMRSQATIADAAILRLATTHGEREYTLNDVVKNHIFYNQDDWRIVETSPFLVWYLHAYYGIEAPQRSRVFPAPMEQEIDREDTSDVPF